LKKTTIQDIQKLKKSKSPFATLTAYDFTSARLADQANIPLILVGDSAAMVVYGYETTIPISMDEMMMLVRSVARGAQQALVVADMPFLSYQTSVESAILNAGRFIKESGAQAVKLEGGSEYADRISGITNAGIPVVAHLGLTPQSYHQMSGYKIQGKTLDSAEKLMDDARVIETAGAFALVLEGIPSELAKIVTNNLKIPTIGIGAGKYCDGQIQVFHDILGMYGTFVPKHTKQYANIGNDISKAITNYKNDVEAKTFPKKHHSAHLDAEVLQSLRNE